MGVQDWSQSTVTAKEMVELVAPSWTDPTKRTRMYYVTPTVKNPVTISMTQTAERFAGNTVN